jgi:PAS domain S-box-containing protein
MTTPQPQKPLESEQQRQLKLTCMNNLLAAAEERVYFKDLLSRFLLVSVGWIAAYTPGRSAEELIGKTDFDVFSYDHAYAAHQDEQRIIRTGLPIVGKLERETYKGGGESWVSTAKMPLRDERSRIIGVFGITRDITAQLKASNPASSLPVAADLDPNGRAGRRPSSGWCGAEPCEDLAQRLLAFHRKDPARCAVRQGKHDLALRLAQSSPGSGRSRNENPQDARA